MQCFLMSILLGGNAAAAVASNGKGKTGYSSVRLFGPNSWRFVSLNSIIVQSHVILNYSSRNIQAGSFVLGITCL